MKILITGHKGYIGSRLYKKLSYNKNISCLIGVDLKDGNDIIDFDFNENLDFIFHMAALPSVQLSVDRPSYTLKHNVLGTSKILELAKKTNAKRVIFSSSAAIYGNSGVPESPYGMHKLMSEMECRLYSNLYNIDTVSLRYFNIFSEDQKYGGAYSAVISAWIEMLDKKRKLRIDGDGEQTRDFIHVDDIISANIFCMNHKGLFKGNAYDVGNGKSISLNSIKGIVDKYQKRVSWEYFEKRSGDINESCANINNGLQSFGWSPNINPIEKFHEYFSKNFNL
tara:strand:- start:101 stop:943 length:843 start_codon:yes stop_codon:yes gene_type:complete